MLERVGQMSAPLAIALFAGFALAASSTPSVAALAAAISAAGISVVLAVRLTTGWPLIVGAFAAAAALTVLCNGEPANLGWFGVLVLVGWMALTAPTAAALLFGAVATAGFLVQMTLSSDGGWGAWVSGTIFTLVACLMAGRQRILLEQLRAAQSGLADRARAEERSRIAQEMHDVIGHALTVTLLHISSARLAIDDEPDAARASLEEAERHARRSLVDVRASIGLLREHARMTTPLPGAANLEELVEAFRRTGAPVTWNVVGNTLHLTAATGLATYRIVQESLTNAARHAPGAATDVQIRVDNDVRIVVESHGRPTGGRGQGTGVFGMHERAESVGGYCEAGPAGHGWRVEAVLPI